MINSLDAPQAPRPIRLFDLPCHWFYLLIHLFAPDLILDLIPDLILDLIPDLTPDLNLEQIPDFMLDMTLDLMPDMISKTFHLLALI